MIEKSELLFEKYTMVLNCEKYNNEVQDDDEIKRNQLFFDFMLRTFICLDGLYIHEKCLLITTIKEDQFRKQSSY